MQSGKSAPRMMRAAEYHQYGPPTVLKISSVEAPEIARDEVLVRVHASSINPIDTIVRRGTLSFQTGKNFPKRTGIDFAGEIVEINSDTPNFKVGDRVWGVMPLTIERGFGQGSAADFVAIATSRIALSPSCLGFIEAASLSSVGAVAIITLREKAELRPGERLLVRGAAGGVGCIAVQLGKALGAHVTVLASASDLGFLQDIGADETLDYQSTTPSSLEAFDVVLDLVGTNLSQYRRLLTRKGRMFCLAIKSFASIAYIQISRIYGAKRVQFFSAAPMHETMADLTRYVEEGVIRPIVHSVFPLEQIGEAHGSIEAGGGRGKRVLKHGLTELEASAHAASD
jgi:NADPH:quinone reductase-like Zn-dependent oxidoreductase